MRDNWQEYKLSDLAKFRRGSFPQPYGLDKWYDDENGHPFIQVYDVSDNMRLKETTKRRISNAAAEQSVFIPKGTIILTIQGSIGRIAITHYDAYMDRTLLVFQSFLKPTDKRYFMYVVHRLFEVEKEKAHGSTIKTITKEQLSSFTIPFPSLPEQQKIAEILSTVDAKIEIIDHQISETQELKKGLMQQLLTKGIGHTEFKDSALGEIPKSWEVSNLSSHCEFITKGSTPTTYGYDWEDSGIQFLRSECVSSNGFILSGAMFISEEANNVLERSKIKGGDILMTITGNVGRVCVYPFEYETGNINQHIARIRISDLSLCTNFVFQYLSQSTIVKDYLKITTGQAYPQLSLKQVRETKIPIPAIIEQNQIAEILSSVDDKLEVLSEKKTTYQELKQGLMQQLLTGKVRV
jgi:type I restriction enzyme S subunit